MNSSNYGQHREVSRLLSLRGCRIITHSRKWQELELQLWKVTSGVLHNYPSLIHCLRAFHILCFAYLLFRCYCYNHYKTQKYYFCYRYLYYHTTLLLNTLLQILSYPGMVELTTQLLILKNILWLPLCRINKFGLNTLPSKTVAIPYTCGLSPSMLYYRF